MSAILPWPQCIITECIPLLIDRATDTNSCYFYSLTHQNYQLKLVELETGHITKTWRSQAFFIYIVIQTQRRIYSSLNGTIVGLGNGVVPIRWQAILGIITESEILNKIWQFSFKKMHVCKMADIFMPEHIKKHKRSLIAILFDLIFHVIYFIIIFLLFLCSFILYFIIEELTIYYQFQNRKKRNWLMKKESGKILRQNLKIRSILMIVTLVN